MGKRSRPGVFEARLMKAESSGSPPGETLGPYQPTDIPRCLPWGIFIAPTVNHCFVLLTSGKPSFVQISFSSIPKKAFFNIKYIIPKTVCQIISMLHS